MTTYLSSAFLPFTTMGKLAAIFNEMSHRLFYGAPKLPALIMTRRQQLVAVVDKAKLTRRR
jgi:hypothetical protein